MSRSLSSTLVEEVFAQEMSEVVVALIEITHDDLSEPIRVSSDPTQTLTNGSKGTVHNGDEYVQFPFEVTLPEQSDNLITRAKLKIDNTSREILLAVRQAFNEPPQVSIKIVLASDPDTLEIEIGGLNLNNVKASAFSVEADLEPQILQSEKYPYNTFNQADFPGIFGR